MYHMERKTHNICTSGSRGGGGGGGGLGGLGGLGGSIPPSP